MATFNHWTGAIGYGLAFTSVLWGNEELKLLAFLCLAFLYASYTYAGFIAGLRIVQVAVRRTVMPWFQKYRSLFITAVSLSVIFVLSIATVILKSENLTEPRCPPPRLEQGSDPGVPIAV